MMRTLARRIFLFTGILVWYIAFMLLFFDWYIQRWFFLQTSQLVWMIICLLFLLLFLNLSTPDFKKIWIFVRQSFFLLSYLGLVLFHWWKIIFMDIDMFFESFWFQFLAGILLIGGIMLLIQLKKWSLTNTVRTNYRMMHYSATVLYAVAVSLFLWVFMIGTFRSLPFSCEELRTNQDDFLKTLFVPVERSSEWYTSSKDSVTNFLETEVADVLSGYVDFGTGTDTELSYSTRIKNSFLLTTLENKKIVDESVCGVIIKNVWDKRQSPWLQFSVISLLFILLYPIFWLVCLIVSIISYILFTILRLLWCWEVKGELKIVEEIE